MTHSGTEYIVENSYLHLRAQLQQSPKCWLVTGVAGFIGSNLLETLLKLDQFVVGLDNFSTGHRHNLEEVRSLVSPAQWSRFHFMEGDIRNLEDCSRAMVHPMSGGGMAGTAMAVQHVLHQAALGSVPRSVKDPVTTNNVNISGFLNMLVAARDAGVQSFTYAASSSTYGDHTALPKVEDVIGQPLSPYAVTKYVNELYASVFSRCYGFRSIGLRYFNVFGRRQDPEGAYAAVIPKWASAMIRNEDIFINGDGLTSRDFCYVENAVQANLLAAMSDTQARNQVYNVAVSGRTDLRQLYETLRSELEKNGIAYRKDPIYRDFREGDIRHSQADIRKAQRLLGYAPSHTLQEGVTEAMPWYIDFLK